MSYNPNIHHRRSARLKGYDYSQAGMYFVTICTHNRLCLFGEIQLNEAGCVLQQCWVDIPIHFPQVELDEYVIMPNHIHGILTIVDSRTVGANNHSPSLMQGVGAKNFSPLQRPQGTS